MGETRPRILCLSAYDAASHRYWYDMLMDGLPEFEWHLLGLPPRFFSWRIGGNPLSWLNEPLLQERWDLIVATSMVDLAVLRGLHPALSSVPAIAYYHENQFFYPVREGVEPNANARMVNLYTALAADQVLFNSAWNRDSFLEGVQQLMARLPDHQPEGLVERLWQKSALLPVPLEDALFAGRPLVEKGGESSCWKGAGSETIRLLWVARWEYDKGPERLLAILEQLEERGTDYRLALLGERFRQVPAAFARIEERFSHRLVRFGYVESRQAYYQWLVSGHLILSTSLHEFQGLAVLEAVACGCVPVVPDRLVYPEQFGQGYLYPHCGEDIEREAEGAAALIEHHGRLQLASQATAPSVRTYAWKTLAPTYRQAIRQAIARGRTGA